MLFVNESENTVRVPGLKIEVGPGETCEVPESYASPRRASNDSRWPSAIERLAPQLMPADGDERERWLGVPGFEVKPAAPPRSRVAQLVGEGASQGVAEVRAALEQAKATGEKLELTAAEAIATAPRRGPGRPKKGAA